jgi:LacI family transcriptional regulator
VIARVNETAQAMGYRPNLLARGLVSDKTYNLGLIINDISWSYFSELSQHIQNAAEAHGYSIFLYSSENDSKNEITGIENTIARRSDGLIVSTNESPEDIQILELASKNGYPVVLLNNLDQVELDFVAVDNLKGMRQVMEYLSGLGHRKIAYIGPRPTKSVERERLEGYESFIKEKFGALDRSLIHINKPYPLLGYDGTRDLIQNEARPTAIVAYNDHMALGVIRAILECGLKIPDDISVIGFDGLEISLLTFPSLTTSAVPIKQIANIAVDLLINRINAQNPKNDPQIFSPQKIKLTPQLVIRNSTGPGR